MLNFRLQKVLEYRQTICEEAKQTYLDARAARLEQEAALHSFSSLRTHALSGSVQTVVARLELEAILSRLDDEESLTSATLKILEGEEDEAMRIWHEKRNEVEMINKLYEKAVAEWNLDQTRKEHLALDEWTSMRRAA